MGSKARTCSSSARTKELNPDVRSSRIGFIPQDPLARPQSRIKVARSAWRSCACTRRMTAAAPAATKRHVGAGWPAAAHASARSETALERYPHQFSGARPALLIRARSLLRPRW